MSPAQRRVIVALGVGLAVGMGPLQWRPRRSAPPPAIVPRASPVSPIHFADVTRDTGVTFVHENGRAGRYRYAENTGAGVALFDYDGDGDLDIYLVNGNRLDGPPD